MFTISTNIKILANELHKSFHFFNKTFFNNELPEPSITIQGRGNRKNVMGWCTVLPVWKDVSDETTKYEIAMIGEYLNRGAYPILATLLHEMVHLYNLVNNIKDTTRNGTYHNKKFKDRAEMSGLIIEHDKSIGWSITRLQPRTMQLIDNSDINKDIFTLYRREIEEILDTEDTEDTEETKSSSRKYVCPSCGTIIRATKEVNVLCIDCDTAFEIEE